MEADPTKAYNQDDATGIIRPTGLQLKVAAEVIAVDRKSPGAPPGRIESAARSAPQTTLFRKFEIITKY